MLYVLIDTCVWLDLAKDHREQSVIGALEFLVREQEVELIVPQIVVDEFQRNKARIIADARRSLKSHFRLVRDAVKLFGNDASKADTLQALREVDHTIVTNDEAVSSSIDRIEKLLTQKPTLATTGDIKQRVTERALNALAPYHLNKNSVSDAILIEIYASVKNIPSSEETRFAFVTHNSRDFSDPNGDRRNPHPDIADLFTAPKSTYWGSLVDLLRDFNPEILDDEEADFNLSQEPRRLSEILEAENLLFRQIWYNRHWNRRVAIEEGRLQVIPEAEYSRTPYRQDQVLDTVWAQALKAAEQTEEEVGIENLGPWDDFEWGVLNGKLSALRWLLGDEWDMLDT